MEELSRDVVADRLARLERGMRRWRAIGSIAWLLLAAALALNTSLLLRAMGPAEADLEAADEDGEEPAVTERDEVRARAFVLVDPDGHPRAALAFRPDGSPALAFTGADGRVIWAAPTPGEGPR